MQILPVVLAGGLGTRLAPLSSALRPKPFVPFSGGMSLYQHTLKRVQADGFLPPLIVGSAPQRFAMQNHARDSGIVPSAILLEASPLGTALAVAVAAHWAKLHVPHAMLAILPCDHFIADNAQWRMQVQQLMQSLVARNRIGLMGWQPPQPDSGLGYIHADAHGNVQAFIEKPQHAAALLQTGNYHANAGQFFASVPALEHVFSQHAPLVFARAHDALKYIVPQYEFLELPVVETAIESFDRLVLEKAATACTMARMPCEFADLGTQHAWCKHTNEDWQTQCAAPVRTDRPWGYFYVKTTSPIRVEKTLFIYPNARLSLQRHTHRSEDWHVISGSASVMIDGVQHVLSAGDAVHIPVGAWHRLENNGAEILEIEEVQLGAPDEQDIERTEDDFGRAHSFAG